MARRVSSQTIIGRDEQLAVLSGAVRAAAAGGESRIVLVTGEAGIGKTRLVAEAVSAARAGGAVAAVGGCIQLGEVSIAFAPLVEALRELRGQLGDEDLDALLGTARPQLRALLDGEDAARGGSGALFEHLLGFLTRLAERQPVLLAFEDLHWADASTRDLVAYLGRNLPRAAVVLVLTVRADELHRRHPLRPVLAGLERAERLERLDLVGLGRAELASLLDEIGAAGTDQSLLDDLHARSGGNPFYVEELVASGRLSGGVPDTLAEIILGRVERLSEQARRLLRAAAVIDDHVDDELLAAVTGERAGTVTDALREAVGEQLLVLEQGLCRFRHALVREALYDDLLPGERTRLHVATATVLEGTDHLAPHTRWALLAYHWDAARNTRKAYEASVRAGLEAEKVHALADAAEQYERALRLRDQVSDPDELAGLSGPGLLLHAADAVQATYRSNRALVLAEEALRALGPEASPEERALVYERMGRTNWTQHRGAAAVAAYEAGAALVADRPPSRKKAFVLAALGQSLMVRALYQDAAAVLRGAIEVAVQVDAPDVEAHARCSLGPCVLGTGDVEGGFAELELALKLAIGAGAVEDASRTYTNLTHCCYRAARPEQAVQVGREGLEYAARVGHLRHYGEAIAGNVIAALHGAGRWAEAERVHEDPRTPNEDPYQELRWLPVLLDSGRLDEARPAVRQALDRTADADDVQFGALARLLAARLQLLDADWDGARRAVADVLPVIEETDDHFYLAQALCLGLEIEAARADALAGRSDEAALAEAARIADALHERFAAARDRLAARGGTLLPEAAAWAVQADAELSRARGASDAGAWGAAARGWDAIGQPVRGASARLRQAESLVRHGGDRGAAAALVAAALTVAERVGATPLAGELRELSRRARLGGIAAGGEDAGAAPELTPRERDVLRLVARGQTNRQIGEELFISEKTASVHVTNLLRKLGLSSRVEAAAFAVRTGLDDTP